MSDLTNAHTARLQNLVETLPRRVKADVAAYYRQWLVRCPHTFGHVMYDSNAKYHVHPFLPPDFDYRNTVALTLNFFKTL